MPMLSRHLTLFYIPETVGVALGQWIERMEEDVDKDFDVSLE